jgi:hypothetical protein
MTNMTSLMLSLSLSQRAQKDKRDESDTRLSAANYNKFNYSTVFCSFAKGEGI